MHSKSRRDFLARLVAGAAAVPFAGLALDALADAAPQLTESDPIAKSLGYTESASKVDASKEPAFKKGSKCSTCQLYDATKAAAGRAPCAAFAGKTVNANGWCRAYAAKT